MLFSINKILNMSQVQSDHYNLILRRLNLKTSLFLILICTVIKQCYCNQLGVGSEDNINNNFSSYVPKFASYVPQLRSNTSLNSGNSKMGTSVEDTKVPWLKVNSSTNFAGLTQQQNKHTNYKVITLVRNIESRLRNMRNVELGITTVQEIFDTIDFTPVFSETNETLIKFSKRMTRKLQEASKIVLDLKSFFDTNITSALKIESTNNVTLNKNQISLNTFIQPCAFEDFTIERSYNKQQIQILNYLKNSNDDVESLNLNRKISEKIRELNLVANNFKNIFYLSAQDHASAYSCQNYFNDLNFRRLYVSAVLKKRIIILFDIGNALSADQLEMSKTFVSNIVQVLSETDSISITTLSENATPMTLTHIHYNETPSVNMYFATPDNKEKLLDLIANIKRSTELTNHSIGFEYIFHNLKLQNISKTDPLKFIYVTRGLLTRLSDAKSVLTTIARGQKMLSFPIKINTCAVIFDEKRIMYEKQFLNDIVHQNYSKYDINVSDWYKNEHDLVGTLYIITKRHSERIIKASTAIFSDLFDYSKQVNKVINFHEPVIDYNSKDVIVSMTYVIDKLGVIGANLYLSDIAEDIINYKNSADSYACLIDTNGIAIVHPALQRKPFSTKILLPVDIAFLENSTDFISLRDRMLKEVTGNVTLLLNSIDNTTKTYSWHRVLDLYVICIISTVKTNYRTQIPQIQTRFGNSGLNKFQHAEYLISIDLSYHRIDLVPPNTPVCRYFRQIATLDTVTLFLSASAFQSPFMYLKNNRFDCDGTKARAVQTIMAYIKDNTGLLANPGLLPRIRNDVTVLYSVMEHLKKRHLENSELQNYIIRRYAATVSGVLQVYPGCVLGISFDPSQRPWFRKAMQHPGRIVVTAPYLDAGGAGYIVTIAHTIFEGKANALHSSERDSAVAIIALDVPYAFFYKIILDSTLCQEENTKCILFENEGYLIAHPNMMEPVSMSKNIRRPYEHLTHKESFLANDMLNHKALVKKLACANYQNRTVQRYYSFNTSLTEVLTNVVYGERIKYQIAAVWGTNIFAAVLNSTCDGGAFCPCSTVDRICLNCNRMDQTDCECPCECEMKMKVGVHFEPFELFRSYTLRYANCEPPSDGLSIDDLPTYDWNASLNSCIHVNCDMYVTHIECLAVMGCEWCQLDLDGNQFSAAFCTTQNACFNGVLSSLTPYGDGEIGSVVIEPTKGRPYSVLRPVGGAIIVLCLVIGFAMYCYRQSLESNDQFDLDSMHDDNYGVPLSRFNFDNMPPPDDGDIESLGDGAMHRNLVNSIGNAIAVPNISPYHMSTGSSYRRPPNGESDHGYSTMTPHEDSEHMCFTLAEPLINKKKLSKSDSLSISTSVSSPTNHNYVDRPASSTGVRIRSSEQRYVSKNNSYGQTVLGDCSKETDDQQQMSPHHILARVTVHRHMEAL